jgi:hypothetical protein
LLCHATSSLESDDFQPDFPTYNEEEEEREQLSPSVLASIVMQETTKAKCKERQQDMMLGHDGIIDIIPTHLMTVLTASQFTSLFSDVMT